MLIDRVCGLSELELQLKNENPNLKMKNEIPKRKKKSAYEFQSVFEYEVKKLSDEYER